MREPALEARERAENARAALLEDGVILCLRFGPGIDVIEAARAAVRGGLRVLEVTLTTPGGLEAIAELAREDGLLVGAGTVLSTTDVAAVAKAGGRFAMSPVFDAEVVRESLQRGLLPVPGAATPGEILAAHRAGAPLVKFFPAGALGGPAFLRAVRGPLGHVPLVPTSGPTVDTMADYVAAGAVAVGVGGEVFPPGFTPQDAEAAARRVRHAMDRARGRLA